MKTIILGFILLSFATASLAIEPAELDSRIRTLTDKFESFQHRPDKGVPPELLRKAHGIILLDRTKAGFLFAYQGGGGVAMVKDTKLDKWSPVAFLNANEASLGFQVGGEQNFYVILLMTTNSTRLLVDPKFEFGGEARGTAGDIANGVGGEVTTPQQSVIVYDEHKGLYGGASVKGGAVSPDDQANRVYYGQYLTMQDILFDHKVEPGESAAKLADKINFYSHNLEGPKTVKN